jgi:hypothetical protein
MFRRKTGSANGSDWLPYMTRRIEFVCRGLKED